MNAMVHGKMLPYLMVAAVDASTVVVDWSRSVVVLKAV